MDRTALAVSKAARERRGVLPGGGGVPGDPVSLAAAAGGDRSRVGSWPGSVWTGTLGIASARNRPSLWQMTFTASSVRAPTAPGTPRATLGHPWQQPGYVRAPVTDDAHSGNPARQHHQKDMIAAETILGESDLRSPMPADRMTVFGVSQLSGNHFDVVCWPRHDLRSYRRENPQLLDFTAAVG